MIKVKKKELTRLNIMESALSLFRENGFEDTTMRLIAKKAEIALGTIYIYFGSKEELVLEYYTSKLNELHKNILAELYDIDGEGKKPPPGTNKGKDTRRKKKSLIDSLKLLFKNQIITLEPDKHFLTGLAGAAATNRNQVSPFSKSSAHIRNLHIQILEEIIDSSKQKLDAAVRKELPGLLWFLQMGVIFYWLHDESVKSSNSITLVNTLMDILDSFIKLQNLPLVSSVKQNFIKLSKELMNITHNGP